MLNAITIDVEDYFQVNAFAKVIARDHWGDYQLRVGDDTTRIIDILESNNVKATFFVLGWVAEKLPSLIKLIRNSGHEIACHGYGHELIYQIGPARFREDIRKAKAIIENITGQRVHGYRAPCYSITDKSLWAHEILVEEGFTYDSSIFPIHHDVYGVPEGERFPYEIKTQSGFIEEFPLSTFLIKVGHHHLNVPIAGGGYLRLLPVSWVAQAIHYINSHEGQPTVLYFHPWEIDPDQPHIQAGFKSSFRHYLNLDRMEFKIRYLLKHFHFSSMKNTLRSKAILV